MDKTEFKRPISPSNQYPFYILEARGKATKAGIILGLDIGTSGIKAVYVEVETGSVIDFLRCGYDTACDITHGVTPVSVYQKAIAEIINRAKEKYNVIALGLSTQMYSICQNTPEGRLAYQWNSAWEENATGKTRMQRYFNISGCPADTIYPAYKLLSLKDCKQGDFLPYGLKEHLIEYLTGTPVSDYSTASASGMFDISAMRWNEALLHGLGFAASDMPAMCLHNKIAGVIDCDNIGTDGSPITVVPALGDGPSASLACREISPLCCNIGTSMAARLLVDNSVSNNDQALWTYAFDDSTRLIGGISSNCCSVIDWANDMGWVNNDALTETGACMFFPWLQGERTPYWMQNLPAYLTGMDMGTRKEAVSSAIFKGVGFTLRRMVDKLVPYTGKDTTMILAGGGLNWKPLLEVILDTSPFDIGILEESEYLAAIGAARSAAEALNMNFKEKLRIKRIPKTAGKYEEEYQLWCRTADKIAGNI